MTAYIVTKSFAYSPEDVKGVICAMNTDIAGFFEDGADAVSFLNFMSVEGEKCWDFYKFADLRLPKESWAKWQEDDGTWIKYEIHEIDISMKLSEVDK